MRMVLLASVLSLCLWYGLLQGALTVSEIVMPSFIPNAKHQVHAAVKRAKRLVLAQSF